MLFLLFGQSKSAGPARLSKNLSLQEALEMASARGRKFKSVDENMDFLDVEIQQHLMEELMVTRNEAKEVAEELEIDDPLDIYCRLVAMKEFGMYSIFEKAKIKAVGGEMLSEMVKKVMLTLRWKKTNKKKKSYQYLLPPITFKQI